MFVLFVYKKVAFPFLIIAKLTVLIIHFAHIVFLSTISSKHLSDAYKKAFIEMLLFLVWINLPTKNLWLMCLRESNVEKTQPIARED